MATIFNNEEKAEQNEQINNIIKHNNKKEKNDDLIRQLRLFIYLFGIFPMWLFVLLPMTIITKILIYPLKQMFKNTIYKKLEYEVNTRYFQIKRKYDIVLIGATGFTGRLACFYMVDRYKSTIKFAIAGRRKNALLKIQNELKEIFNIELDIIVADMFNLEDLEKLVNDTKVILTTVGPYALYGNNLVHMCAIYGTSYCDITGETNWVRSNIDNYHSEAKLTGAQIVHFCGHDCVPWDLCVLLLNKKLKEKNDSLSEVTIFEKLNASASGGTYATIFNSIESRIKYKTKCIFDPLLLNNGKSQYNTIFKLQKQLGHSNISKSWIGQFIMSRVMANCIKRSNAINEQSKKLIYKEAFSQPNLASGIIDSIQMLVFVTCLLCPPLSQILKRWILPQPGYGPSLERMDEGFLKLDAYGIGENKEKAKVMMYFNTDPAYRDTARMLIESGICLLYKQCDNLSGGVYTPATCQGSQLVKRLVDSGTIIDIK